MLCQFKNVSLSSSTDYVHSQWQLCNRLDIVGVQGWWCNLVLFPAGSQSSEQADRKSKGHSDKPCVNGVRSHSCCSQSHFPSGLFETSLFFFIFVASLAHFSLIWAVIKLSLGMYTWQRDEFWMIICCHIVLDIESADNLQLGISVHTVIDSYPLHKAQAHCKINMQYLFAKRKLSWFLSHLEN